VDARERGSERVGGGREGERERERKGEGSPALWLVEEALGMS
jgi:hypothetical protein